LKEIYNLKNDRRRIKLVQNASLGKSSNSGLKIVDGILFGTKEWFNAIETGKINKVTLKGTISKVYMSGHDDYPEFEIENESGKSNWTREGNDNEYRVGRNVELVYVEQLFKRPLDIIGPISQCVIQIKME
jgi:hypothetical protein